ncbi:hypothetical protein Sjap_012727 [Stephania japonica]|uniref:Thioredoxin-like protein n=1 Tax=Stephania japonica TaxID=461633 RepID=A0AAP0IXB9_9MAGN
MAIIDDEITDVNDSGDVHGFHSEDGARLDRFQSLLGIRVWPSLDEFSWGPDSRSAQWIDKHVESFWWRMRAATEELVFIEKLVLQMAVSAANPHMFCKEIYNSRDQLQQQRVENIGGILLFSSWKRTAIKGVNRELKLKAFWQDITRPSSMEMEPITDAAQLDQILDQAKEISQPIKMPTIQLWKDGEMKEEVIGGHKAWIVIDEVREMIQKYV